MKAGRREPVSWLPPRRRVESAESAAGQPRSYLSVVRATLLGPVMHTCGVRGARQCSRRYGAADAVVGDIQHRQARGVCPVLSNSQHSGGVAERLESAEQPEAHGWQRSGQAIVRHRQQGQLAQASQGGDAAAELILALLAHTIMELPGSATLQVTASADH